MGHRASRRGSPTAPTARIQYAENPPKKYQDIYPLDFESEDWRGSGTASPTSSASGSRNGVTVFRVDNPHTKAFAFWEWVIADDPRRDARGDLPRRGVHPAAGDGAARQGRLQPDLHVLHVAPVGVGAAEYFDELATRTVDFFRPNAWPNTPDILTEQLQTGGRAMFAVRAILAATLSPAWGVYGPAFELLEHMPCAPGSEEYLDSEKYQLRQWDLHRADSLAPLLGRLNHIRRDLPALAHLRTLRFHDTTTTRCSATRRRTRPVPAHRCSSSSTSTPTTARCGSVDVDLAALGLPYESSYRRRRPAHRRRSSRWQGAWNYVDLDPDLARPRLPRGRQ